MLRKSLVQNNVVPPEHGRAPRPESRCNTVPSVNDTILLPPVSFPVFTSSHVRVLVSEATRLHKLAGNTVSVQQGTKISRSLSELSGVLAEA